ncbi:MAG: DUF1302 family protein [Panacagrimonas sp.]
MKRLIGGVIGLAAATVWTGSATAGDAAGSKFLGGDFSYNALLRLETAFSTSGESAYANQFGDPANGKTIMRQAGDPALGWTVPLDPTGLTTPSVLPLSRGIQQASASGANDVFKRYVPSRDNDLNYHIVRFEITPTLAWGDFSLISRFRAVYEPGGLGYRDFDYGDYDDINGGIEGGEERQFGGSPDYLGYGVREDKNPLLFERSGKNYMIDLPAFFLQWNKGNTTVRVGNQSIAWGQLLFFRVMDQANGLDLRRHLILDRALEEYADERGSAPGIRVTVQATDTINADMFAQQFVPTILGNVNTPYNVVPSQFTIHDNYVANGYDKKFNFGMRLKGEFGNMSAQAMFTSKLDQLGSIRWVESGVNKALPNSNPLGAFFNGACEAALVPAYNLSHGTDLQLDNGCGPLLALTPFEASPGGVFTAEEWYNYAGYIKLDSLDGLNKAVDDFDGSQQIFAQNIGHDNNAANNQLDAFFIAGEGLRGHIERDYYRQQVFGLGAGYVFAGEPGSFMDQLIVNVESTYTRNRKFTSVDLGHNYDERDEVQVGMVMEKYQRFSPSFPATYLVFQYLWQKESDLAGLLLDGYGSENFSDQGVRLNPKVPTSADPKINPGVNGGANYLVFAALQPSNAYIFEYSVAALVDVQGGVLIQPGVQWKPRGDTTVNLFYNYVEADAWGGNANNNLMSLIDFADELTLRLGYQF